MAINRGAYVVSVLVWRDSLTAKWFWVQDEPDVLARMRSMLEEPDSEIATVFQLDGPDLDTLRANHWQLRVGMPIR